ncbi:MAG: Ig-like domain-containing domain, partial [Planctomycetota bacterium]
MCKKLLYLMVLILVLLLATEQASAWTKTIGFEDGTVGQKARGTADSFDGAGTDSLFSDTYSSEGDQSCNFHFRECEGIWGKAHGQIDYPANITYGGEVWIRCYIYQKSPWSNGYCGPFTSGNWKFFRIARRRSDGSWRGYTSIIGRHTGPFIIRSEACPVSTLNQTDPYTLQEDKWECVEFYVKFHETQGIIRMWINGELKVEQTNFQTSYVGDYAYFSYVYTTWNDKPEHDMDSYMDSIVITTNTPGQQDSYGNPMIGLIDNPKATNPSPANGATDVGTTADLSWTAGTDSTSSNVYFGTDSTPDSGELQGNQTATTFDPGTLSNSTTYYWRIDELKPGTTTTGTVWSFTTVSASLPGAAGSPSPADSATDVSTTADLSWTAGSGATSHDVYF